MSPRAIRRTRLVLAVTTAGGLAVAGSIRAADPAQPAVVTAPETNVLSIGVRAPSKPKFQVRWQRRTVSGWWTNLFANRAKDGFVDWSSDLTLPEAGVSVRAAGEPWTSPTAPVIEEASAPLTANPLLTDCVMAFTTSSTVAAAESFSANAPASGAGNSSQSLVVGSSSAVVDAAPLGSTAQANVSLSNTGALPREGWSMRAAYVGTPAPQLVLPAATTATSGTLSSATSVSYSTAPWVITAGDGTYPDLGGVATFNEQVATTPGTFPTYATITIDQPIILSGITYNSYYEYYLVAGTGGSLSLTNNSANVINVATAIAGTPITTAIGQEIAAPIGGGAAGYGLTKSGPGALTLEGTNTYVGGTTISGGTLFVSTGDAGLGATGAGNDVTLDGGTFGAISTAVTTARNFTLTSNGGTINTFAAVTINGVVGGAGNLTFGLGGSALTLTANNTYSGTTTMVGNGTLALNGNGSINQSTAYDFRGIVGLDSSGTYNGNRLNDTAPITARGVAFTLTGNATTPTTETVGAITLNNGVGAFTVVPNSTAGAKLAAAGITRANNSLLFVRGTGLGGTAGAVNVATITATGIGASLVGGGGAAGSTTISILPWAIGNVSTGTFTPANNAGSSFVTYDATNGFRPLATAEYASTLTAATAAANNVRLTAATASVASGSTCNALLYQPASAGTLSGGTINITSGAFLYSPTANVTSTLSAALNFGTAEGIIVNTSKLNISGAISGSGGVTYGSPSGTASGTSTVVLTNTASSYTGNTTLDSGAVVITGTVAANGTNSVFGSNGAIVLNAGVNAVYLESTASASATINRDINVIGSGTNYLYNLGTTYTVNGNVGLSNNVYLYNNGAPSATYATTFGGNITGTGAILDTGYTYVLLNGNNTYSGGTTIGASSTQYGSSTFIAGTDTAFGTGTIYFTAYNSTSGYTGTSTLSGGSASRTLANNLQLGATVNAFAGTAALTLSGNVNLNGSQNVSITNTSAAGVTFSGLLSNGGFAKSGTGLLTLSNAAGNNYTGGTLVSAGSLLVTNTSGSGTGSGAVRVTGTGSLLGGTGFIVGPAMSVASGAILQGGVGGNTGTLTLNTNLTLASGSIIQLGLAADGTHSTLARGGGTWTFDAAQKFGFLGSPTVGQTYDNLITGLSADPGTESGWTVTNNGFTGTFVYDGAGGIDLTMTAVPEPATVLGGALTVGLFGLGLRRRLRRAV